MSKPFNIHDWQAKQKLAFIKENQGTQVTDYMWRRMSDEERIEALYSVVKDPDEAQKYFDLDWEELPSGFERDMRVDEMSTTGTGASFKSFFLFFLKA